MKNKNIKLIIWYSIKFFNGKNLEEMVKQDGDKNNNEESAFK